MVTYITQTFISNMWTGLYTFKYNVCSLFSSYDKYSWFMDYITYIMSHTLLPISGNNFSDAICLEIFLIILFPDDII